MAAFPTRRIILLFLLALAVRISLIFLVGTYRNAEGSEVINVAKTLAQRGEFADAYGPGTGSTAHTAPAYPFLLSLVFRVFGTGLAGEIGQETLSSTFGSLSCAMLPVLGLALGLGTRAGWWAGLWAALIPVNFYPETKGSFEGALTGLCLVLTCLYFARCWARARFSTMEACAGGVAVGIGLLASPALLPFILLALAMGAWLFRTRIGAYLRYVAMFMAAVFITLAPWAIRNQLVLGSPTFGRSNLGLELMLSNNDEASADLTHNWDRGILSRNHPFLNNQVRDREVSQGEVAFHRDRMAQAKAWIMSHPGRFLTLTVERVAYFWFPEMARLPQTVLIRLEVLLALAGYVMLLRTSNISKWLIGALWLGFPSVYYLVQVSSRYRYPIEWSFVLLGAFAISMLYEKRSSREHAV